MHTVTSFAFVLDGLHLHHQVQQAFQDNKEQQPQKKDFSELL